MKYLKYFIGIIGLIILVFFLIGIVKPQVAYDCEIVVDKPLEEAWAVAQDEEKMLEWLEGFERVEHVSGTPGNVGSVTKVHFNNDGQEMTIKETITAIEPNKSVSMFFESDFMNMDYTLSISPIGSKSKLSSSTTAKGNGMLSKSIMAMIAGSIKAQEDTNLISLKKTIEQNTKIY